MRTLVLLLLTLAAGAAAGQNNAMFVSQNVPTVMVPGQIYSVSVTMQNTGTTTWTRNTLPRHAKPAGQQPVDRLGASVDAHRG